MKDFLIVYEVKKREIENAYLLKVFLEHLGYSCDIANFYESQYYSLFGKQNYKVIIVPQLYHTEYVARVFSRFGPANTIFNLQCEQVLSDDFEAIDLHTPKGEARLAHHVCWGKRTHEKLAKSGISKEKLPVLGALSVDFIRKEIASILCPSREEIAEKFNLDPAKKWLLFTSSFTFADMPEDRRKMDERLLGIDLSERIELFTKSRLLFLEWLDKYLPTIDHILIYRPHPDEYSLLPLYKLQEKYPNFRIIPDYSVRVWTYLCDSILNWYSTSCVEAYFLKKPYFVVRPLPIPADIELTLMRNIKKIETFEDFKKTDFFVNDEGFHDNACMESFYSFDVNEESVTKYVRELSAVHSNNTKVEYTLPWKLMLKSNIKTYLVFGLHQFYGLFLKGIHKPSRSGRGFIFGTWFRAFYYNIANPEDRREALEKAMIIRQRVKTENSQTTCAEV
ncbi:hypothetical protein AZI87_13030 [Bdellovibrio bacteriovorus]|uniref:Uncharacterized protein n=1 Tax=Bdellovibrio bacteriovorus TaxID=959 RepID=A0A161PPJ2_BDEBC|nr:hypothetical protein [Bdellovibrio bacteriovorus]KYG64166.1 hypothetical protein AZI87_13030 [Bdellovibrio bacteriovorus]